MDVVSDIRERNKEHNKNANGFKEYSEKREREKNSLFCYCYCSVEAVHERLQLAQRHHVLQQIHFCSFLQYIVLILLLITHNICDLFVSEMNKKQKI